jgi:tRNA pseudouridine55 synthase
MHCRDGLILLDKPAGITSFQALTSVKRILGTRKVGHTGTLDKFAEGLLIALTGSLTRMVPYFLDLEKDYIAVIRFGIETDTLDPEGTVVKEGGVPELNRIEQSMKLFQGEIQQIPPEYSAIHVEGQRAYKMARGGTPLSMPARRVIVHRFEVLSYEAPELTVRIRCSKGTYIRAIGRDLGREVGSCASLTALKRVSLGRFHIDDAVVPSEFDPATDLVEPVDFIDKICGLRIAKIKAEALTRVRHGARLEDEAFVTPPAVDGDYALFSREDDLLAVTRRESGAYSYVFVNAGSS